MPLKDISAPAAATVSRICDEMTEMKGRRVSQKEGWELAAEALDRQWQQEKTEAGK